MKKSIILLLILGSILSFLIYQSYQFKIDTTDKKSFNKDVKYYDNDINIDKVLSHRLTNSGTLEEEQVNDMKINYNKTSNSNSAIYQPLLPSLVGTSDIEA
jgi:hypothetical protein|tara:strand:+ start:3750 stop:4052 length:303 start_codon:yes stop_codon:yes gene_type:complete